MPARRANALNSRGIVGSGNPGRFARAEGIRTDGHLGAVRSRVGSPLGDSLARTRPPPAEQLPFAPEEHRHHLGAGDVVAGRNDHVVVAHEAVGECAVIGLPDEERGQIVAAFVVLKPDVLPDEATAMRLQDHVKANIAPYKYPRTVRFLEALPKTQTGQIQRFQLKFLQ